MPSEEEFCNAVAKQELSYDAWGRLRNPATQVTYTAGSEPVLFLGRGYTGHEHLPWFGLVNMNARLYDPLLGRFLSPDPYVQAPNFTQNFNRYSYCLNNPLVYVDEDGEFIHLIIGAVVGGTINVIANWKKIDGNFWKGLGYFGVGAAAGTLSAAGGAWAATTLKAVGVVAGAGVGAVSGGILGGGSSFLLNGGNNLIGGNNFLDDWKSNLTSGAIGGAVFGGIGGGIKGYKYAKELGANRWTGNKTTNRGHFSSTPKTGILPQQDITKHCYSVSGEYADAGQNNLLRTNLTRNDFQEAAARLNNGVIPDGADIGLVASEAGLNSNVVKMGTTDLLQFGANLQNGTMEGILTIGSNLSSGHTVNIISFDVVEKLKIFGGGSKFLMTNTRVWDPLTGSTRGLKENIMKFVFIKY